MTALKKMTLNYGGGCAVCHGWIEKGEEAFYDQGRLYHIECVDQDKAQKFEDEVLDRLAEIHERCKRIEDKLVSLGYAPGCSAAVAMEGKK